MRAKLIKDEIELLTFASDTAKDQLRFAVNHVQEFTNGRDDNLSSAGVEAVISALEIALGRTALLQSEIAILIRRIERNDQ